MRICYVALTLLFSLIALSKSALGAETDTDADVDDEVLRAAKVQLDGPSLLTLFRKRTPDAETRARLLTWIDQLGSLSFPEREEASAELETSGVVAVGLLHAASHHDDLEIRHRVRQALSQLERKSLPDDVLVSALRVLARRKPARTTETLIAYAEYAVHEDIVDQLCVTLASVAKHDGNADPLLVRALNDSSPLKRAVAGSALCRADCRREFPAVRRLLRDSNLHVRRRVALALLEARDKAAVPASIELLAELPRAEAESIESMLLQLAGDSPPQGCLDDDARGKYRDAWADWWKRHGETLDLAKIELSPRWRGYTLVVCFGGVRARGVARSGCLLELDAQGRTRWQMPGLVRPVDAQVLGENRILVTEYIPGQVTERNRDGDILRRISVGDNPLEARRLPNGNTLITTRSRVFEVDRNDKEVWKSDGDPTDAIVAACPLRGGEIVICHRTGELVRLNREGKVLASFRVGRLFRPTGSHIQGLPNGHILIPSYYDNKVMEFDKTGREVWSASYPRPICAQRLPNGRTLVASYGGSTFAELDKQGREVKSQRCEGQLMAVSGR
jgi:hypothetical protein